MQRQRPIGVFDSGVGGLTVLAALRRELPDEDLLYLGDTARVPYGTRSPGTVERYALRVASLLYGEGIKALVVACNTATTHALPALTAAGAGVGVPVIGVIEPGVREALRRTRSGRIAVLGTEGTIRGGRYQELLAPRVEQVSAVACGLFVALAEEGWTEGEVARLAAERYLAPLRDGPDTVILGCTHYPLLRGVIEQALPGVAIVDSAESTAAATRERLAAADLLRDGGPGRSRYLVTDNAERFERAGERFLGERPEPVTVVDLDAPAAAFGGAA